MLRRSRSPAREPNRIATAMSSPSFHRFRNTYCPMRRSSATFGSVFSGFSGATPKGQFTRANIARCGYEKMSWEICPAGSAGLG